MLCILDTPDAISSFLRSFRERASGEVKEIPPSLRRRIREVFGREMSLTEVVDHVIEQVGSKGDDALVELEGLLDGVDTDTFRLKVEVETIEYAWESIPIGMKEALSFAADRIRAYQESLMPSSEQVFEPAPGERITTVHVPVDSVGVYVPGGRAAYPSTVLMSVIPAQVAGVRRIAVVTPPAADGDVDTSVLAACRACGVEEVYRLGGAQAIAALALGTASIQPVDVVVGPGNIFVSIAKKSLYGRVGIDMIAGPSELFVVADEAASPSFVAEDMLGQAEHGPMACSVLVTTSRPLVENVCREVEKKVESSPRREILVESLEHWSRAIIVGSTEEAAEVVNAFAPEHLEVMLREPECLLSLLRNAGAVFVGSHTPESLGDYTFGPSHVLPTGGAARFSSGLSVFTFLRRFAVMEASADSPARHLPAVDVLASAEGLEHHLRSLRIRVEG